jgi:phosphotransferase system HPr (HPr) family protein
MFTKSTPAAQTVELELIVLNKLGFHARPAAQFVRHACRFSSRIEIVAHGKHFSAQRIMDVLLAKLSAGTPFQLVAEGPDAEAAVQALATLVRQFAEDEHSPAAQRLTDRGRWFDLDD